MKKIILSLFVIFWGLNTYAQENDTTKIKLGDTKIIIIEKDKNKEFKTKEEKLEKGKEEFEKMQKEKQAQLDEQQKQLDEMKKMLDEQKDEEEKQKLEKELQKNETNVEELAKELEALEKGIEDIERELEGDNDWDNDDDEESKMDRKNKYDWDFEDEWPSDWDNLSPFGKDKKFRGHWAGFELGLNNYVNKDFSIALDPADQNFELSDGSSWVFALNFLEFNIPFGQNAGLVTGMGTSWNNYHFRNNVNIYENVDGIMVAEPELQNSYYKNTLNMWSFSMPLILEFQIPVANKKPGVFIGLGVVGSAKVTSSGKIEYTSEGIRYEEKRKSDFLINTFRYGLTARIGFKYLKLFANYDLVPLFEKDRGPELYPVSIGLTLLSF